MKINSDGGMMTFNTRDGDYIAFRVSPDSRNAMREVVNTLEGKRITIDVRKHFKRRSVEANAYAWELMGRLSATLRQSKIDVYRNFIRDIGDNFEIVPVRDDAVDTWRRNWEHNGDGWVCDVFGKAKTDGYTLCTCYYGSSTYDSRQMSVLIDAIVAECKDAGIETLPPDELKRITEAWHEKKKPES